MIADMLRLLLALGLCIALSACSGGGSASGVLPSTSSGAPTGLENITLSIRIPGASTVGAAIRRRPLYISPSTQSASVSINNAPSIVINLGPNSPNCVHSGGGSTCSVALSAPVGVDTFAESLYATTNATGAVLSKSVTSATILAGKANVVSLVLNGVIASLSLALADATPPQGIAAQIGLAVTVKDASGATIIGNDPFVNPVTLTDSDKSGITGLSKTLLNSPADNVGLTVSYNGQPLSSATFSAISTGVPSASVTLTPAAVAFNDYTTFGYDNQRDIYNPNSATITPTSVGNLHLAWQSSVGGVGDYSVQAQPILATEIPNHAGVLFVGGASGHIAAHDALTGASLWRSFTGQIVYNCDPSQPNEKYYLGVGGTAAYDPGSRALYVVGNSNAYTNGPTTNSLVRLDAGSGSTVNHVDFGGTLQNNYELNFAHTAVTLSNGTAYVGTGASCDISSWRGRVSAINVSQMSVAASYFPLWNPPAQPYGGGGIWGWGGVSLDFNGNVLTGVGNADVGGSINGPIQPPFVAAPQEYSGNAEAFMELSGDLSTTLATNHPIARNIYNNQASDLDLNGTPAIFQSFGAGCPTMAALQGKSGGLFVYDIARISSGPSAQYQLAPSTYSDGFLGSPAFSKATGLLYAAVASSVSPTLYSPGMMAVNPGCGSPSVVWHTAFGPDSTVTGVPRGVPAVSAGGVVFVSTSCDSMGGVCGGNGPYGALWELDAMNGTILNGGKPVLYTNSVLRAPATIDGNWVYVVDTGGELYGLTVDQAFRAVAVRRRSTDARSSMPHSAATNKRQN